jgi:Putative methionine and alanine importer, small subunit
MSTGAIIFMVLAITVLWGGLAVCLRIAIKNKDK